MNTDRKSIFKHFIKFFLQGLLVVAPIAITIYLIYSLVMLVDNWVPFSTFWQGRKSFRIYGLGFIIVIGLIYFIGYLSSFFLKTQIWNYVDSFLEKTPGIKYIYSTSKDFFEAFAGDKKKFTKPVLANLDDKDVWRVGFLTQENMNNWDMQEYVAVYIPMSFSVAGNVYLVHRNRVKIVKDMDAAQSMKFAMSGGVTDFD